MERVETLFRLKRLAQALFLYVILSIGSLAEGFSQHIDGPSLQIQSCSQPDAMGFITRAFPDGSQIDGSMSKHCFKNEGLNRVILEWMDFVKPGSPNGSLRIKLNVHKTINPADQMDGRLKESLPITLAKRKNGREPSEIRFFWATKDGTYLV